MSWYITPELNKRGSILGNTERLQPPPIGRGIDYLVYAHVLEITAVKHYGQFRPTSGGQIWPKLSKGISENQDLSFEPIIKALRPSVHKFYSVQARVSKNRRFGMIRPIFGGRIWHIYTQHTPKTFIWLYSQVYSTIRYKETAWKSSCF